MNEEPVNVVFDRDLPNPDEVGWNGFPHAAWEMQSCAVIACDGRGNGCVLYTGGPAVKAEIQNVSDHLGDIGLDDAPAGLSVWVGKLLTWRTSDGEYEGELKGAFRPLQPEEWKAVQAGVSPWNDADWGRPLDPPEEEPTKPEDGAT